MAIARDNSAYGASLANNFAFAIGSVANRLLLFQERFSHAELPGGSANVSYGGVALTKLANQRDVNDLREIAVWYLIAPASGTANIVANNGGISVYRSNIWSYSGVKQTGFPDAFGQQGVGGSPANNWSDTLVSIASNCWLTMAVEENFDVISANNAGTSIVVTDPSGDGGVADTNGAVAPGSHTLAVKTSGVTDWCDIIISIAPAITFNHGAMFQCF